jgi:hypothetical protein
MASNVFDVHGEVHVASESLDSARGLSKTDAAARTMLKSVSMQDLPEERLLTAPVTNRLSCLRLTKA